MEVIEEFIKGKYEKQELRTQSMQAFISLNPKRVFINHLGEIEKIIPIEF